MQVVYGRKLGTNLIQLGVLDLETLSSALAEQLQVPAALVKHFDFIMPRTLAMLPVHIVSKYQVIPLGVLTSEWSRPLVVAFVDPHDVESRDNVAFCAGSRIMPSVAPELRIAYYLEKFYGVTRDQRFLRVGAPLGQWQKGYNPVPGSEGLDLDLTGGGADRRRYIQPNPPLPDEAWPPQTASPTPPPPATVPRRRAPQESIAIPIIEEVPEDRVPAQSTPPIAPATPSAGATPAPVSLHRAVQMLAGAGSRDEIGDILVGHFIERFGGGLALIVRDAMVLGWKGFVPGLTASQLEGIALPLAVPSMFARVCESREVFAGVPPEDGAMLQGRFFKLLGEGEPIEVAVAPVVLKERVVLIAYGQRTQVPTDAEPPETGLAELCAAASAALVRLIQDKKRRAE